MTPITQVIHRAREEFAQKYGFSAESIHVSRAMEKVLHRWAAKNSRGQLFDLNGAEIVGMEILRSTKATPWVEFWLSTRRGDLLFTSHFKLSPGEAGASVMHVPGVAYIE